MPILNPWFELDLLKGYFVVTIIFASWATWREKRLSLLLAPIPYLALMFVNSYIYLEQFVKEVILKRKNLVWFKPDRIDITAM